MRRFADSTLARAFDAHLVAPLLADGLDGQVVIEKAQVADVLYRQGRPCWLLYRFKLRLPDRKPFWQLVAGRLGGVSENVPPPPPSLLARYLAGGSQRITPPVVRLPEFDLVLYAFPLDEAMPTLVDTLDPDVVRRELTRAWTVRKARVRDVTVHTIGYTPGARAAVEYELVAESGGLPELRRLIGKMHASKSAARRFADAWVVWRAARGRVGLAPPAGYLGALDVTLQDRVRGVRLGGLVTAPGFNSAIRQTARMLATLHGLSLPLTTRRTPADEAATVQRWSAFLSTIRPDLGARVAALRDRITADLESRASLRGPVHADFHHTNVLVDQDTVTFIDLDEIAFGDPLVDVGRFLASLRIPALRVHRAIDGLAEARDDFLATYLRATSDEPSRVRLFEAAALFTAAASAFRIQRPNWVEETDLLLAEAERVRALSTVRTFAAAPSGSRRRPALDRAAAASWIDDPIFMRACLDPHVRERYGVDLVACEPARPKSNDPEDGIRLRLEGWRDNERWRRTLYGTVTADRLDRAWMRRINVLADTLGGLDRPPLLPGPVAYIKPLSLAVWDVPDGTPLVSLLAGGSGDAGRVIDELARALALIHRAPVALDHEVTLDQELGATARAVARVSEASAAWLVRARSVCEAAARLCRQAPLTSGPSLRRLSPRDVLWCDTRIGLLHVERIAQSQPLVDAGDLLARLALIGLERPELVHVQALTGRFRSSYAAQAELADERALAAFEADALVRLACSRARSPRGAAVAERLLDHADARVAASAGGPR